MADIHSIQEKAKRLNLQNLATGRIDFLSYNTTQLTIIEDILGQELAERHNKKTYKNLKESKLPKKEFDFTKQSKAISWQIEKLMQFEWIQNAENMFVIGECGTGKTSLLATIGRKAIESSYKILYLTVDEFMSKDAKTDTKLKNSDLIVLDDVMYLPLTEVELQKIYRSLTFLNETRSIVIITNRELSSWLSVATDKHLMQTLLDRLVAGSQTLRLSR